MLRHIRRPTYGMAAALLALLLTACGGATPAPTSAPTVAAVATDTTSPTTESTTAAVTSTTEVTSTAEVTGTMEVTGTVEVTGTSEATATTSETSTPETTSTAEVTATSVETSSMPSGSALLMSSQSASLGTILVDAKGMTLYTFKKDTPGTSACTGACVTTWPPFTVTQGTQLTLAPDITGTVDIITRTDDSSNQVTFNGLPLYYFSKDTKAGDTNGQGLNELWYVVPVTPTTGLSSSATVTVTATP